MEWIVTGMCILVFIGIAAVIILTDCTEDRWSEDPYDRGVCEDFRCLWKQTDWCEHRCDKCEVMESRYICQWCRWEERCQRRNCEQEQV